MAYRAFLPRQHAIFRITALLQVDNHIKLTTITKGNALRTWRICATYAHAHTAMAIHTGLVASIINQGAYEQVCGASR